MYISITDLLLTFVLVDDWYQRKGRRLLGCTVGSKPEFSDSEMLTLMLAIGFFEFTSGRRFVGFLWANYRALFPKLLDQSQYNRRARSLRYLLNELRKDWAAVRLARPPFGRAGVRRFGGNPQRLQTLRQIGNNDRT